MDKKRLFAALMSASMLCGITALAAEDNAAPAADANAPAADPAAAPGDVAQPEETMPERVLTWGKIKEIRKEGETVAAITIAREGKDDLVLNVGEPTIGLDSQTGLPVGLESLKEGDSIYAFHSPATTMSLPPQSAAEAIISNVPQDAACAMLHTVEKLEKTEEGGLSILTDNGSLYIRTPKQDEVDIKPLLTKNIVTLDDVKVGDRFFAWYGVVAESYLAQAFTEKLVLIPGEETDAGNDEADPAAQNTPAPAAATPGIVVDDDMVLTEVPVVKDGVTMVPLRSVAEALGCTVTWNQDEQSATISDSARQLTVYLGKDSFMSAPASETGLVGTPTPVSLGCAPYAEDGRIWVPAKAFETMVGYTVTVDGTSVQIAPQKAED